MRVEKALVGVGCRSYLWNMLLTQRRLQSPPAPANVEKAVTVPQLYAFVFFLLPENKALVIGAVILVFSFFAEGHSLAAL